MDGDSSNDEGLAVLVRALAHAPDASAVDVVITERGPRVAEELTATPPSKIGELEVVRAIGAGGMGVIYEAIDPRLKRRVAIKLLRARRSSPQASARLLREAQALAQLSHPNIVVVYNAGNEGDLVYLVMELVAGSNAQVWRDAAPRTVAEIVDVYRQASVGLSVAHAIGLVHRDVKPENILVGDDGRVRVTDFGLVAGLDADDIEHEPAELDPATGTLTQTGTILGTLPYIAPEAHTGQPLTARADQWSLCVALWEALSGERPHAGATHAETIDAIRAGRLTRGRDRIAAPIRAALERGLAIVPEARWPSFDTLFAAIGARPRRRIPRWPFAAVAGIAVAGGGALLVHRLAQRTETAPIAVRISEPGACPYSPVVVDSGLVFDDGNGDIWLRDAKGARALVTGPANDWRANRGRTAHEAVYVSQGTDRNAAGFVDVTTGKVETLPIDASSFAFGGGTLFYGRTDTPEIRRVRDGDDARAISLPDGLWPYTVAATADGRRIAVTTALDRSAPTICLADLDAAGVGHGAPTCLQRDDIIVGRPGFSPDGDTLYYQTSAGIRRRDGGGDELWLPGAFAYGGIDVAPDGSALYYSDSHPTGTELAPAEPDGPPVLKGPILGIWPLPAGGWLTVRHLDGRPDSMIAQESGATRVIIPELDRMSIGGVDVEGKRATFDLDGPNPGIYVVDLRPYPPVRLTTTAADSNPIFTRDGRVAFARWDAKGQPSLMIVDPGEGVRGDAQRTAAHPLPRVPNDLDPVTGELILLGLDGHSIYAWDPATGRERTLDSRPVTLSILQVAVSPDGQWLAALDDNAAIWRLPLKRGDGDTRVGHLAKPVPRCGTGGRAVFDHTGRLHVITKPWLGDIYRVAL